ncbi:MAG: hypothetical protein KGZ25_02220 [Planctomycetes bacterium]|nr:hypothetical protein [Planctomycetota bacterium]
MSEILRWFWMLPILGTIVNAIVTRIRAGKYIRENPGLRVGYRKMLKGLIGWGSFCWVVMGIGCTVGDVPNVLYYLHPNPDNAYIVSFYASYAVTLVAFAWWIYRGNGVQMLLDHPGFFNAPIKNAFVIKLFTGVIVGAGMAFIVVVWFTNVTAAIPMVVK